MKNRATTKQEENAMTTNSIAYYDRDLAQLEALALVIAEKASTYTINKKETK